MNSSGRPPSATSLPRAPRDEADARSKRYLIMMGIRVACFILMVVITPYGWYTWVFGAAAIFIPYVAVVLANVGSNVSSADVERPELAISAIAHDDPTADPAVVRVDEIRAVAPLDDPDPRA